MREISMQLDLPFLSVFTTQEDKTLFWDDPHNKHEPRDLLSFQFPNYLIVQSLCHIWLCYECMTTFILLACAGHSASSTVLLSLCTVLFLMQWCWLGWHCICAFQRVKREWKPLEDRSCTDLPWFLLFMLFCGGMVSYLFRILDNNSLKTHTDVLIGRPLLSVINAGLNIDCI